MRERADYETNELAAIMAAQGRKRRWLAIQLGVSEAHVSRILNGERSATKQFADRVAALLQVPFFVAWKLSDESVSSTVREEAA